MGRAVIERFVPAINGWFVRTAGGEQRPPFLDIDATYPALRRVDAAFAQIRAEALALLADRESVPTVQQTYYTDDCLAVATPNNWRIFYLVGVGLKAEPNCERCPETTRAVYSVPGLFQAQFSILEAGKSVAGHTGPYAGYLRYHLPLVVPTVDPPRLRVKDVEHVWREGEAVLFDDSYDHEVYNTSPQDRVVLLVDIPRPMPLLQTLTNWIVRRIGRRTYGRIVVGNALRHKVVDI
jgi:aspartyl/asparaginyl beta-hydroxylase (cupin superfamily)